MGGLLISNILVSIATSLIVSLITFTVGLKSGKNQQDREMKQKLYKELYLELKKIKQSIERNEPINYLQYERIHISSSLSIAGTPIKKIINSGNYIYLNQKILKESEELELNYFKWSHKFNNEIAKQLYQSLPQSTNLINGKIVKRNYHNSEIPNHFECSIEPQSSYTISKISLLDLIFNNKKVIKKINDMPIDDKNYLSFELIQRGTILYSYTIQSTSIIDKEEFLANLLENINRDIGNTEGFELEKIYYIKQYNAIIEKIEKKAIDPEGFWETLFSAFKDIFKC